MLMMIMMKTTNIFCCAPGQYDKYTKKDKICLDVITLIDVYLFAILPDIAKFNDPIAHVIDVNNNGIIKHLSILNGK